MIGDIIQGNYLAQMRQRDRNAAKRDFYFIPKTARGKVLAAGLAAIALAYNAWDLGKDFKKAPEQPSGYSFFYEAPNRK